MDRIENKTSGEYTSEKSSLDKLKNLPYINITVVDNAIVVSPGSMFNIGEDVYAQDSTYTIGAYDEGKYVVVSSSGFAIETATPVWSDIYSGFYSSGKRVLAKLVNDQALLLDENNYMSGMGMKIFNDSIFDYCKNLYEYYDVIPKCTNQDTTAQGVFRKVIWTGTYYVGAGSKSKTSTGLTTDLEEGIAYSTDLINWTWCSIPNKSSTFAFIIAIDTDGSGNLIAANNKTSTDHRVWRSTNHGVTWSNITSTVGAAATQMVDNVTYANGYFFILGGESSCIFYSSNLTSWTKVAPGMRAQGIAYGASIYVISGSTTIYSSSNLSSWTLRLTVTSGSLNNTRFINNTFVTFGATSTERSIWTSTNGTSFTGNSASNAPVEFATWSASTHAFRDGIYYDGKWWIIARGQELRVASTVTGNYWSKPWITQNWKVYDDSNYWHNFDTINECNGNIVIGFFPQSSNLKYGYSYAVVPKTRFENITDF